ncbi:uroporphyrinogen decarboxylase family protein [Paludicola sp. MB14-C6]|uniref:uroporphyrinogen decarboxylase family protein n=1 Tax=Paludihabitans sp. MB14-C6 TaxID=3070656 RepID=UPI0027DDEB55|nr:uroporphyrinogen decarboxylase family protein [Paludicola sp. MB14-C6]WMJ22492.1 uroporphyrinogen decarboxylase family protein [Paludicola sp. MB14-C6]
MTQNFAKLHEDVCFKRSKGKVIWQPRIDCWITDKLFDHGELPGIYKDMSKVDIYKELGCSARIYEYNDCFYPIYDDTIHFSKTVDGRSTEHKMETPVGTVTRITKTTPSSWAELVTKEWVCNEEDLKVFTYIESHTNWGWNQEHFDKTKAEWGNLGAPTIFMPRTSMQRLYIDLMGVEEAVYAVMDYPETVEEYFDALRECHFRLIDVINESPIHIINFGDNIHSGTLSPSFFEEYVLPEYKLRTERLHKAGKFICSHFDGDNKGLMEYYQQTGLDGVEAITPVPQGDVTLEEAKENLGDMFLLDGIPAVYFDEIYPVEVLEECVHNILDLFAPNLILGISDEISSTGDIERIKLVGKIVDEYNAQFE